MNEAIGELGNTLSQMAEASARAAAQNGAAEARARNMIRQGELRTALERNDPSFPADPTEAANTWLERSTRIRDEVAEGIRDPGARALFMRESVLDLARDGVEAQRFITNRTSQQIQADVDRRQDGYAQQWMRATTPAEQQRAISAGIEDIRGAVAAGALSPVQGANLEQRFQNRIAQAQVLRDINTNPAVALQRLNSGAYNLSDPVQVERLAANARSALQASATQANTALLRQERADRLAANQAEIALREAVNAGNTEVATQQLAIIRQRGQPGQYASAAELVLGVPDNPLQAARSAWVETRLRDRANPLTRQELETARASRQINDTTYQQGLQRLAAREDARFSEAERFVDRALEVPSPATPANLYTDAQREALRQQSRIMNDLVIERQRNPDVDPLTFVRERLDQQQRADRAVVQRNATAALARAPVEVRTPEGLAQIQLRMAAYQAYRGLGWADRQRARTVEPPTVTVGGRRVTVTPEMLQGWVRLHEGAAGGGQ